MKKIVGLLLSITMLITSSIIGNAIEIISETKVKINDISVTVPYNEDEIEIVREENFQEVKITILDSKTGEIIRTVGELKSGAKINYTKTIYEEYNEVGCKSRLYATFKMYSSGSFAEIVSVESTSWEEASSGGWDLRNKTSNYLKMAPNRYEIYGRATITAESTTSIAISVGYSGFKFAGFNVTGDASSVWTARKIINGGFVYSI